MVHMQSKSRDIPTMAVWLLFLILAGQAWGVMLEQDLARAAAPLVNGDHQSDPRRQNPPCQTVGSSFLR